jgi:hypothetical protein
MKLLLFRKWPEAASRGLSDSFREAAQAARQALEVAGQSNPQFANTLKSRITYYESRIPKAE